MEKVIKNTENQRNTISPDTVRVKEWGIDLFCGDSEGMPIPIIYCERYLKDGIGPVFLGLNVGTYHGQLNNTIYEVLMNEYNIAYISSRLKDVYIRIWLKYNVVSFWLNGNDITDVLPVLKNTIKLLKNGKYYGFFCDENNNCMLDENNEIQNSLDFNNLMFYWEGYEDDEMGMPIKTFYRAPISEIFNGNFDDENQENTQNNNMWKEKFKTLFPSYDTNKKEYDKVDPAYYHLKMYQENKKRNSLILNESDIRIMIKECVRKIMEEKPIIISNKN